jgi:parallel beta-helix repeat protein
VPEDERLIIEPGVEMRFRRSEDAFRNGKLVVYGSIEALGTEGDSIIFKPEIEEELENRFRMSWDGVILSNTSEDSSIFEYCTFEDALSGVYLSGAEKSRISYCTFKGNYYGLLAEDSSRGVVSGNLFLRNSPFALRSTFSNLIITNNSVIGHGRDDPEHLGYGFLVYGNNCLVSNNKLENLRGFAIVMENTTSRVYQNIIRRCFYGFRTSNHGYPEILNNTVIESINCFYFNTMSDTIGFRISNNIIAYCDTIAIMNADRNYIGNLNHNISNNLFFENPINFVNMSDSLLGIIDIVNANGDSCDSYSNIFINPLFIDIEAGNYELTENSPCIDAGVDVDLAYVGESPDIGALEFCRMGVRSSNKQIPEQFSILSCYPNPFNSTINISYTIPHPGNLSLSLYDIQGRNISHEVLSISQAGRFSDVFDLSDYPTGVYILEMGFESVVKRQKLVLVR